MRITCHSVADFLVVLEGEKVYQKTIYVNKTKRPLNGNTPRDATSFEVVFQASAVIDYSDGGQALVECGEICGIDRESDGGEWDGSEAEASLRDSIQKFCKEQNLTMKPGILDM